MGLPNPLAQHPAPMCSLGRQPSSGETSPGHQHSLTPPSLLCHSALSGEDRDPGSEPTHSSLTVRADSSLRGGCLAPLFAEEGDRP